MWRGFSQASLIPFFICLIFFNIVLSFWCIQNRWTSFVQLYSRKSEKIGDVCWSWYEIVFRTVFGTGGLFSAWFESLVHNVCLIQRSCTGLRGCYLRTVDQCRGLHLSLESLQRNLGWWGQYPSFFFFFWEMWSPSAHHISKHEGLICCTLDKIDVQFISLCMATTPCSFLHLVHGGDVHWTLVACEYCFYFFRC